MGEKEKCKADTQKTTDEEGVPGTRDSSAPLPPITAHSK